MMEPYVTFEVITREVAGLSHVVISVLPDGVVRVLIPLGAGRE